jgi:predicted enzyme related to lactoylglutathione lyase
MKIQRLLSNLCSQDLKASKQFYTSLFDFDVKYESDWFIHLVAQGGELELGIILEQHDIVPKQAKTGSGGVYLTFVVEDVGQLNRRAQTLNYQILQEPELTFYGQNRMLLLAPEGTVLDVSSPS